jgi:hypothetical protein
MGINLGFKKTRSLLSFSLLIGKKINTNQRTQFHSKVILLIRIRLQEVDMKKPFLNFILIAIIASIFTDCTSSQAQVPMPTGTPPPATSTETIPPTATVEETPTLAETATPTPLPLPTFPLELTQTPGIFQTATAFAATATQDYLNNL